LAGHVLKICPYLCGCVQAWTSEFLIFCDGLVDSFLLFSHLFPSLGDIFLGLHTCHCLKLPVSYLFLISFSLSLMHPWLTLCSLFPSYLISDVTLRSLLKFAGISELPSVSFASFGVHTCFPFSSTNLVLCLVEIAECRT
jgi:hypothetical protein